MSKIGLVVEGGGMKCAYGAGVLDAFLDDGISFDYCIGVSAGSANTASFLAGQRGRNLRFYTDHIKEPGYFGFKSFLETGDLFGLKYIYATLSNSNGEDALDYQKILDNPAEFLIVATNARTGKPAYFRKHDMKQDDYRAIMASCALPAACRPIRIDGEKYYDGGVSDSIPVQKALDDGCDKIVVITSKPRDFIKKPEQHRFLYTFFCQLYPRIVHCLNRRHIMYAQCQNRMFELEKDGKAVIFAPSENLPMSTYAMNAQANRELYNLGMKDYYDVREQFKDFMKNEENGAVSGL
ncbi:MAG: patatin family protein [Butyrivibrio sp.]|nr:patatin family protein [Butyrivibrio sp.]